jgi:hypothetical protein
VGEILDLGDRPERLVSPEKPRPRLVGDDDGHGFTHRNTPLLDGKSSETER